MAPSLRRSLARIISLPLQLCEGRSDVADMIVVEELPGRPLGKARGFGRILQGLALFDQLPDVGGDAPEISLLRRKALWHRHGVRSVAGHDPRGLLAGQFVEKRKPARD